MDPQLTYAQLRSFNAVAREGSFTSAARRLGLSQPAVTAQIRALESGFGVFLFERTGVGTRMTPLGLRLYAETQALGHIEDRAHDILTASQALEFGELHVMCGAPNPAMGLIAEYRRLYPGVRVVATFGNWHEVSTALFEHRCDAAILTAAPADASVSVAPYVGQRVMALIPNDHQLASGRSALSIADLKGERVIFRTERSLTQKAIDACLKQNGVEIDPVLRLGAREAVYEAVTQGLGIGFMFELAVTRNDGLVRLPIAEMPEIFMEDVVCLTKNLRRREVSALMDLVMATPEAVTQRSNLIERSVQF